MIRIGAFGANKRGLGNHYANPFNAPETVAAGLRAKVTAAWDREPGAARALAEDLTGVWCCDTAGRVAESSDAGVVTTLDPYDHPVVVSPGIRERPAIRGRSTCLQRGAAEGGQPPLSFVDMHPSRAPNR